MMSDEKFTECTKCGYKYILADTEDWDEPLCHSCYEERKLE